jgi:hypothetical protein
MSDLDTLFQLDDHIFMISIMLCLVLYHRRIARLYIQLQYFALACKKRNSQWAKVVLYYSCALSLSTRSPSTPLHIQS